METKYEDVLKRFRRWLEKVPAGPLLDELKVLEERLEGPEREKALHDIYEAFYKDLEFGTGGLRGILGVGTNRMNVHTIERATQGLADYVLRHYKENPVVAIGYDSRINSDLFANTAAEVMAANGIGVYLYPELVPTPMLSYAVRHYGASAGIMVTASHNPAEYNGYKVYNDEGCQMTIEAADEVLAAINRLDTFDDIRRKSDKSAFIRIIPDEVFTAYLDRVKQEAVDVDCGNLEVVFTPLNGAGRRAVTEIMKMVGVGKIHSVPEQEHPDGNFPTCPYPNPEKEEALALGLALSKKLGTPDLLIATDPDCDRVGIAVKHEGDYKLLTGNEVGALLLDFLCQKKKRPENGLVIKTIVTSDIAKDICAHYGLSLREVLTGFKFIGEIMGEMEREGREDDFFFGYEESYGYLSGPYVRDKDAVNASMLICQMAAYYRQQGKTLVTALKELHETHGYYVDSIAEFAFEGSAGMEAMKAIMRAFREKSPSLVAGREVDTKTDYMEDGTGLPKSEVIKFTLKGGGGFIARPSGTEPKLKIYLSAKEKTREESLRLIDSIKEEISKFVREHSK